MFHNATFTKIKCMLIKQLYTTCLGQCAYFIESNGEAAVIDPMRDIEVFIELAKEHQASIKYIFETHLHADFVSGHLDLQRITGAPIVFGPLAETRFPCHKAKDNENFRIGEIELIALHTPGHTIESTCYLLKNESGEPHAIFTGDTLLINNVGSPDTTNMNYSVEELAGSLFDSLQTKILTLPGELVVYPAHATGTGNSKDPGQETFSTIKELKENNVVLQSMEKSTFIETVTTGLKTPPSYFELNKRINKEGYESLHTLMERSLIPLDLATFKKMLETEESILLDTRAPAIFTEGFIPGSINIGLAGRLAEWAGTLLPFDKPIILVTEDGQEKETITRLTRVGFTLFNGFLQGGFQTWKDAGEPVDMIINVEADELAMDIPFDERLVIIDVRRETEFGNAHVKDAVNIPLEELADPGSMANLEDDQNLYIHCASGFRSVIASSLLKKQGIHNLRNVTGGFNSIEKENRIEIIKEDSVLN